ncbi:MAG: tRNA (adenosine(37)-N6)-threonylcarbamoyltransferase complex ATPase subunit type 1 TsaE [Myxococcales bacterium]|jgi:tRNA threonylcarbamoyladenosine biosynthesis protein TsaE|nr:tRNA (adenosine(37)-N6)-threonylcarbamoyltransferase complex ATPase subunit type 1 TsaE [Myxococcales bacterium]
MDAKPLPTRADPVQPVRLVSRGPLATRRIGRVLGERLQPGDVVLLEGPLGAGKTCFAQGLAAGLGVPAGTQVVSPSFALVHQHQGRLLLLHADLYRLERAAELQELGLWEALAAGAVLVIEWASRFPYELPTDHVTVELVPGQGLYRQVTLRASGPKSSTRLRSLLGMWPTERRRHRE